MNLFAQFVSLGCIALFILVSTALHIMFKTVALGAGGRDYAALILDPLFYVCGLFFVLQTVIWLMVLRRLPLSHAYPFTSLTVITLIISGAVFFGESVTLGNIAGGGLIIAGVLLIGVGSA